MNESGPEIEQNFGQEIVSKILIDFQEKKAISGNFSGAVITKLNKPSETLIFSDNISITESNISLSGLCIKFIDDKLISVEKKINFNDFDEIDFSVRLNEKLVNNFDEGRFFASFPNIIRFLHTVCLYSDKKINKSNHLKIFQDEILNKVVCITHNEGIIIAGRLVVGEDNNLTFYNSILIGREANKKIKTTYEYFISIPLSSIKYLAIIGSENF